jgi:hypothetical protein
VSVRRRLEALEGQAQFRRRIPEGSREARQRMVEHLAQVGRLRRGELDPEEAAEVEAFTTAVKARLASGWGEGRR